MRVWTFVAPGAARTQSPIRVRSSFHMYGPVSAKEEITAVAFARFRPGEMRLMGFSRDDKALPEVRKAKAWAPLLRDWKTEAERLAGTFARGEAGVDPKRDLMTCRYCGLETLSRVYEKINVLAEEEPDE